MKHKKFILAAALLLALSAYPLKAAFAFCCICIDCMPAEEIIPEFHDEAEPMMEEHIVEEFTEHRDWLTDDFLRNYIPRALMEMTEQMSAVAMFQVEVFGMLLDAKHQAETQRLFNEMQNEAHRDYQPSDDFCWFGTNVRSLAHSEALSMQTATALSERSQARMLGSPGAAGAIDRDEELLARWNRFTTDYCDSQDNNFTAGDTGMVLACGGTNRPTDQVRANRDIDYTRLIDDPRTINVNFTNPAALPADGEEEDVLAMANNLYGHQPLARVNVTLLENEQGQHLYLALRSIAAKRSVAENSYNTIVGLKASGSSDMGGGGPQPQTREFLAAILNELGVADENGSGDNSDEIYGMIGERPSYYAQLEILAKRIYQNPDFYASLYDSPANVARKSVALKAIELMLERAMYESETRQEMLMSVLLASESREEFRDINKDLIGMSIKQ